MNSNFNLLLLLQNFVALEEVFKIIAADYEMVDMYEANRKLLSALGSCFVQVVHKAQTIFQVNAKYEAELVHLREEHSESKATLAKLDSEKKYLVCRLQSALLDNHKLKQKASPRNNPSGSSPRTAAYEDDIQLKLANEMAVIQRVDWDAKKLEGKCIRLENENSRLRLNLVEMESELVGARLDSKYLDKELAGRIQQIQILLASGTSQEHKQKVWSQIESEMHLQRSKTISNMCYSKQKVKDRVHSMNNTNSANKPRESNQNGRISRSLSTASNPEAVDESSRKSSVNKNCVKQVMLHKNDTEELGMAILGGKEHGLPIMVSGLTFFALKPSLIKDNTSHLLWTRMLQEQTVLPYFMHLMLIPVPLHVAQISEVFPDTAIGKCNKVCAGDIILAVNGESFCDFGHEEAVRYLSSLRGTIKFSLENRVDGETDDVCDMGNRYYNFLDVDGAAEEAEAADGDGGAAAAGRDVKAMSPGGLIMHRHPGRAMDTRKDSRNSVVSAAAVRERSNSDASQTNREYLPEVHSSPNKKQDG